MTAARKCANPACKAPLVGRLKAKTCSDRCRVAVNRAKGRGGARAASAKSGRDVAPAAAAEVPASAVPADHETPAAEAAAARPGWEISREREAAAKAEMAEMELVRQKERLKGERASRLSAVITAAYGPLRVRLLGLPTRIRQRLPHLTVDDQEAIEQLVHEAMELGPALELEEEALVHLEEFISECREARAARAAAKAATP